MSDLADLKPGDRVQVFDVNGRRMGQPQGGWDGAVTKVGRKLVTVKYGHDERVFRLDTGQWNNKDFGPHLHIKTVAQADEYLRRAGLVQRLRDGGVDLKWDRKFATETLEALVVVLDRAALGVREDPED